MNEQKRETDLIYDLEKGESIYIDKPSGFLPESYEAILGNIADLKALDKRTRISHRKKITTKYIPEERETFITFESESNKAVFECKEYVREPEFMVISDREPVLKLYVYLICRIDAYIKSIGKMDPKTTYRLRFPLSDLIRDNLYTSIFSARKGFNDCMPIIRQISFRGSVTKRDGTTKKTERYAEGETGLIAGSQIIDGICQITLSPDLNYKLVTQYTTIITRACFSLPSRAFTLYNMIANKAQQMIGEYLNGKSKNVIFSGNQCRIGIKLSTIQLWLNLPQKPDTSKPYDEENRPVKNPGRDVAGEIIRVSDSINEMEKKNNDGMHITVPERRSGITVWEWVENERLIVTLKNEYKEKLINRTKEEIESNNLIMLEAIE